MQHSSHSREEQDKSWREPGSNLYGGEKKKEKKNHGIDSVENCTERLVGNGRFKKKPLQMEEKAI